MGGPTDMRRPAPTPMDQHHKRRTAREPPHCKKKQRPHLRAKLGERVLVAAGALQRNVQVGAAGAAAADAVLVAVAVQCLLAGVEGGAVLEAVEKAWVCKDGGQLKVSSVVAGSTGSVASAAGEAVVVTRTAVVGDADVVRLVAVGPGVLQCVACV